MLFALSPLFIYGQKGDAFEKRWEEMNQDIQYNQSKRPKGPQKDYISPHQFNENQNINKQIQSAQPSNEDIIYSREQRFKDGTDKGVKKHIKNEEDESIDDLSTPDSDAPNIEPPYWDSPEWDFGDGAVFKYIFIIIAILLVVFLIYYFFFKSTVKSDQEIGSFIYDKENDINPETIQKSQLEKDLDAAIETKNYRAAIRIYYILLLKALIEHNWIKWAKRKTNTHYLAEMATQEEYENFNKAVNMYEWSWYGKNMPNEETFERFSAFYNEFLKRLKDEQ
jgi:hypothetical protein